MKRQRHLIEMVFPSAPWSLVGGIAIGSAVVLPMLASEPAGGVTTLAVPLALAALGIWLHWTGASGSASRRKIDDSGTR